ncbi:tryptophan synthase beta subunit-like PLP-dependent enzyme [Dunaliella salina]|uniref:Tryptophan synthase beta subunit-like PLP-dependent enzyme n=1 Tax=Dunaliella salina TaxID=3046 RepID=A0ABQ7HA46_DUNSA|nr:tryptophan synthase beta subunit-like PLP-dependent enzyme [Dunaliella salina]|eukprot:KAF5843725.1 tryptophan synthase beta subunit-like PLP-dependent enzyme [Dunaliella salina]
MQICAGCLRPSCACQASPCNQAMHQASCFMQIVFSLCAKCFVFRRSRRMRADCVQKVKRNVRGLCEDAMRIVFNLGMLAKPRHANEVVPSAAIHHVMPYFDSQAPMNLVPGIAQDVTQVIGNTPLVFLNRLTQGCHAKVAAKLEFMEPCCSVKILRAQSLARNALNLGLPTETVGFASPNLPMCVLESSESALPLQCHLTTPCLCAPNFQEWALLLWHPIVHPFTVPASFSTSQASALLLWLPVRTTSTPSPCLPPRIGLAFVAASKGYKLILTMPASMSLERRVLLKAFGAELVLTGETRLAPHFLEEMCEGLIPLSARACIIQFFPSCFPGNKQPLQLSAAGPEIWQDTAGQIDILVCTVGTGGTITGIGEFLIMQNPNIKVIAVEPAESPVLSGGKPGPHKIQGIGAGFVPGILNAGIIDEILKVPSDDSIAMAKRLAREEGLFCGISSGAAAIGALEVARRKENEGMLVVTVLPSFGERYLSSAMFADIRTDCERMGINERILYRDFAGRERFVP